MSNNPYEPPRYRELAKPFDWLPLISRVLGVLIIVGSVISGRVFFWPMAFGVLMLIGFSVKDLIFDASPRESDREMRERVAREMGRLTEEEEEQLTPEERAIRQAKKQDFDAAAAQFFLGVSPSSQPNSDEQST